MMAAAWLSLPPVSIVPLYLKAEQICVASPSHEMTHRPLHPASRGKAVTCFQRFSKSRPVVDLERSSRGNMNRLPHHEGLMLKDIAGFV
jgi:hypothetical protein